MLLCVLSPPWLGLGWGGGGGVQLLAPLGTGLCQAVVQGLLLQEALGEPWHHSLPAWCQFLAGGGGGRANQCPPVLEWGQSFKEGISWVRRGWCMCIPPQVAPYLLKNAELGKEEDPINPARLLLQWLYLGFNGSYWLNPSSQWYPQHSRDTRPQPHSPGGFHPSFETAALDPPSQAQDWVWGSTAHLQLIPFISQTISHQPPSPHLLHHLSRGCTPALPPPTPPSSTEAAPGVIRHIYFCTHLYTQFPGMLHSQLQCSPIPGPACAPPSL